MAQCYYRGGYYRQAERIIRQLHADDNMSPGGRLLLGRVKLGLGDVSSAMELFEEAEEADPRLPSLHVQLGNMYLQLRRFDDAERAFKKAS